MPTTSTSKEIGPRTDPETQRRAISERGSRGHLETEETRKTVWPGEGLPPKGEKEKPEEEEKAEQKAQS